MSVTDPLLKKLKGFIYQLRTADCLIDDQHPCLQPFCETLEVIFRKGLKQSNSIFGVTRRDYWSWVEVMGQNVPPNAGVNPQFEIIVDLVQKCRKVSTVEGRGRTFIRLALQRKCLLAPIDTITANPTMLNTSYDSHLSIIADEILCEILKSLLFQVPSINFHLNTRNCTFLEDSWLMPIYDDIDFVPCKDLGVKALHYNGRVVVASITKGGVAEDSGKIGPGDIVDEVLKEPMRNITKGKIPRILKQNYPCPVRISVIRRKQPDGSLYRPAAELLRQVGIDPHSGLQMAPLGQSADKQRPKSKKPPHAQLPEDDLPELPIHNTEDAAIYRLQYLGKTLIGEDGGVHQIEVAISKVLEEMKPSENPACLKDVIFELSETDVLVTDPESKALLNKHSYTEISACGRRTDVVDYFAYVAGETTCTLAKQFVAYIFKAEEDISRTILCSIAQGFGRTHWFV